ncbi:MAG: DUF2249 domain-containing protein [Verrucomicrobia bacterium]|nr:DUF2249 domain-containing protein [Verrucomicrobiota bacterium]
MNTNQQTAQKQHSACGCSAHISNDKVFDVRDIPCSVKHGQILDRWRNLKAGDYFILMNDHDPIPLRYQFEAEFAGAFTWEHLQKGPDVYQVKIARVK